MPPEVPGAKPDTVASLVSYLVQPESHFITGETLFNIWVTLQLKHLLQAKL